ncbi:MAG: type II toxin-antitoxin system HicA family toxin [Rectinemataceae bacterium]
MKSWTSRDILKVLAADGWVVKHQVRSHVQLAHPTKPGKVTVPHPRKDLAPGAIKSIAPKPGLIWRHEDAHLFLSRLFPPRSVWRVLG